MPIRKSLQVSIDFFDDVKQRVRMVEQFSAKHDISIYELQLLLILYKHENIQLRTIIQEEMIKQNQINKAVKNLYEAKVINKERLPHDERTVQLSIREEKIKDIEKLIKDFSTTVGTFTFNSEER